MKQLAPFQENRHFHCDSGAIVFHWIGDASYKCQSEHGTHSYGGISRGIGPALNCLFVLWEHSCWEQTTAEQWENGQRAPASWTTPSFGSQDGSVSDASHWNSTYWGYATFSQDNMRHPPGWTTSQILLSLPALQLSWESNELLTPILTESVQEAGSAVSGVPPRIVRVCLVHERMSGMTVTCVSDRCSHWRQFSRRWMISAVCRHLHDVGLWVRCLSWNGLVYTSRVCVHMKSHLSQSCKTVIMFSLARLKKKGEKKIKPQAISFINCT